MSVMVDSREDLHFRMAELQQKLRDSEEERRKLERTCDVLIKTFREEHKVHYRALKLKYEKFLEDCNLRRKRNDIILRSLSRVEDKAKVIHAKTEKLKLLKDRYIAYLKQNEFLKAEEPPWKTIPSLTQHTISDQITHKSVHWKTPIVAGVQEYKTKDSYHTNGNAETKEDSSYQLEEKDNIFKTANQDLGRYDTHETSLGRRIFSPSEISNMPPYESKLLNLLNTDNLNDPKLDQEIYVRAKPAEKPTLATHDDISRDENDMGGIGYHYRNPVGSIKYGDETSLSDSRSLRPEEATIPKHLISNTAVTDISSALTNNKPYLNFPGLYSAKPSDSSNILSRDSPNLKSQIQTEYSDLEEVKALREKGVLKHQESIDKLKTVLEKTDSRNNGEILPPDLTGGKFEESQKDISRSSTNELDESNTEIEKSAALMKQSSLHEDNIDEENENIEKDFAQMQENFGEESSSPTTNEVTYLKGLDGVDYQNETYPASYYEQPVHTHNYSNIASNVILEEDEYELDAEQQETTDHLNLPQSGTTTGQSSSPPARSNVTSKTEKYVADTESDIAGGTKTNDFMKNEPSDLSESEGSDGSELKGRSKDLKKFVTDRDKIKEYGISAKSNLTHLLESDSESFQIEHGDAVSVNDDSDFDFSFHQNPE